MQEGIAPRDRIHKSDGRQPLTDSRQSVILSAKRNLDDSLTVRTKISHEWSIRRIYTPVYLDIATNLTRIGSHKL